MQLFDCKYMRSYLTAQFFLEFFLKSKGSEDFFAGPGERINALRSKKYLFNNLIINYL